MKSLRVESSAAANLAQQISWISPDKSLVNKKKNSSLNIGLISSERLYLGMRLEGNVYPLTHRNWKFSIAYSNFDFILVESCYQSCSGDWFMAQSGHGESSEVLEELVSFAKERAIPVVYWFTLDVQYVEEFNSSLSLFDVVFCADDRAANALEGRGVKASYLPPAVQPALFSRLKEHNDSDIDKKCQRYPLIFDDVVDMAQRSEGRMSFYSELADRGAYFFDSMNQIWATKAKPLEALGCNVLGTVPYQEKSFLFSRSNVLGIFSSNSRTRTEQQWSIVEAAASHVPVLLEPDVDVGIFQEICINCASYDEFNCEIESLQSDELYRKRVAQIGWREAVKNNSFSNRVSSICNVIGVAHDWEEYPTAALITPSYRSKFIPRVIDSYSNQTYINKEMVLVFNGPMEEYEDVKASVSNLDIGTTFVPPELHAGPCMNSGISKAKSDFVFRMDDDDFYGPNYLLDMMLYTRVVDFDVIGKVFRYFVMDGEAPIYQRESKNIVFDRPAYSLFNKYPKRVNFIAGCSHGGNKDFFVNNPYPAKNFAAVDTQWLYSLEDKGEGVVISVDEFNLLVDRRSGNDHTWVANVGKMQKASRIYGLDPEKVCFV
ncbi:glycosyltransferase [Gilvimarinus agarilyticus]|uniref:glycosyltransferase n=1 Tax=Gilvimarinus agarilyticus TaxID=679259 RepID=UPI0005A25886|nr:glycosyltransferase [Gilvimarinus agarilyticus]